MTFRTRLFVSSIAVAAVTLAVATALVSWSVRRTLDERIERSLVNEARLAAETLSHRRPPGPADLDEEADALGALVSARITFIAADGTVVGDSELDGEDLRAVENHAARPEVQQALGTGLGVARRYSTTISADLLYVAVPVRNSESTLSVVRLALPTRRLIAEEISFSDVLENLRSGLANRYLADPELAVSQIAWLLGYREVGAFSHAFKRWTGKTPSQARREYTR